jgi:hypothetical protein
MSHMKIKVLRGSVEDRNFENGSIINESLFEGVHERFYSNGAVGLFLSLKSIEGEIADLYTLSSDSKQSTDEAFGELCKVGLIDTPKLSLVVHGEVVRKVFLNNPNVVLECLRSDRNRRID